MSSSHERGGTIAGDNVPDPKQLSDRPTAKDYKSVITHSFLRKVLAGKIIPYREFPLYN